jgi:hypothetical protein
LIRSAANGRDRLMIGAADEHEAPGRRIGQELEKSPKASGEDRKSKIPAKGNLKSGKADTGVPPNQRSRLKKLAKAKGRAEKGPRGPRGGPRAPTIKEQIGSKERGIRLKECSNAAANGDSCLLFAAFGHALSP